ncbi:MAG: undecaprenyl-phosphate glucose phosphotransferase [Chloroflexota bacterium]|nr:undecaprenyl-phosphate glucose phosphotransferase [Caldilinea sp.]GIK71361.1 MAG: undecaprenyl-phosphate glucose phosphotransferase [Chloroflexota bacterium]
MQQSISDRSTPNKYVMRRSSRPGVLKRAQALFMLALVIVDLGSIWLAFWSAYTLLRRNPEFLIGDFSEFLLLPGMYTAVLVVIYFSQHMYQRRRPVTHLDELFKIIIYNTLTMLFTVALLTLLARDFQYHRAFVLLGAGLTIIYDAFGRVVHAQLQWLAQARGIGDDRVLLIGAGEIGQMLLQKITMHPKLGYQVVGVVDAGKGERPLQELDAPLLGSLVDVPALIDRYGVDEVIIGLPESSHQDLVNIISLCEREKVGIRVFPDVFQIMASEVTIGDLGGLPLLTIRDVALQGWKLAVKRGMDIVFSAVGLVILSPFMLLTALLIKLDSPGPVFYSQERMGLDARPFKIIKFRSMRHDAETDGPGWTTPDDPRKTKLGAFMRRFNIDELPQLVNVLVGDMSLVGPRPERPVYVEQFRQIIPRYMDRHREKAGLTGWAQVNGLRGDTSIVERTKYDLWYIENWSIGLDIMILIRTILQTIFGTNRNAY